MAALLCLFGAQSACAQALQILPAELAWSPQRNAPLELRLQPAELALSPERLRALLRARLCTAPALSASGQALPADPCGAGAVGPVSVETGPGSTIRALPTAEQLRALAGAAVPAGQLPYLVLSLGRADGTLGWFAVRLLLPAPAEPEAPLTTGTPPVFTPPVVSGRATDVEPEHEPGQLLVLWPTQAEADAGLALLASRYHQRPRLLLPLPALGAVIAQLQLPDTRAALALRDTLRADQPGWVSDLNARSSLQAGPAAAPPPPRLYALKRLHLDAAPATATTPPIKLGVVDAALDPALALHTSARTQRSVLGPADVPAPIDHGAVVAQLIAGPPLGNGFAGAASALNPGIHLLWASAVRQVNGQPRSHSLHTLAALDWLLAQGAQLINLSLGGVGDAVLEAGIARLREWPVLLVAAAGNNGPDAPPVYPAAYPGVLAVTAIDNALQPYGRANRGDYLAVAAPGVDVWVPVPAAPGADAGQYVSGTSFATALVTATLARASAAWWQQPKAAQLASLCRSAQDLGAAGRDPVFGCGLLSGAGWLGAP